MLSKGGAARAMLAMAKYSARFESFEHTVFSLKQCEPEAVELAKNHGVRVLHSTSRHDLYSAIERADIVQLQWWNNPELSELLNHNDLPPMRLSAWFHVGGHAPPQIVNKKILNIVHKGIACSPYTQLSPYISSLSEGEKVEKIAMVYGASDFERLANFKKRDHNGFNIGYIGTIHPIKMHEDFIQMSQVIEIPDARIIVAGSGSDEDLRKQSYACGKERMFDFRGYADDISSLLEELDVFGYPLCEDTYAASEMVLQEVMYTGIPSVVFPHGGIKNLIVNNYTGLVVRSNREYKEAIEYLYHNPEERKRIGDNAKNYARQIFGAENAARAMNKVFKDMLHKPKEKISVCVKTSSYQLFLDSLEEHAKVFETNLTAHALNTLLESDSVIINSSHVFGTSGICAYADYYKSDAQLQYWKGLFQFGKNDFINAAYTLQEAIHLGYQHPRILLYMSKAFNSIGKFDEANLCKEQLLKLLPEIESHLMQFGRGYTTSS